MVDVKRNLVFKLDKRDIKRGERTKDNKNNHTYQGTTAGRK
jgi:hypothetical protein